MKHFSIYQNLRHDAHYKAATGLSIAEFDALFLVFSYFYTPKSLPLYDGPPLPVLTDKREALFFILYYYKTYPTLQNLGLCFGISNAAASKYLDLLKPCLKAALQQQHLLVKRVFTGQQEFDALFEGVTDLFFDVTEVPIERAASQDIQKLHFSGKKKFHTLKWLLVCDAFKRILFVSACYPGHVHDFTMFKDIFANLDFSAFQTYVDLGFLGIKKRVTGDAIFLPHKASKNKPLTEEQKAENTAQAKIRIVIENAIAKVKSFFIFRVENRMKLKEKLDSAFEICASLANLKNKSLIVS